MKNTKKPPINDNAKTFYTVDELTERWDCTRKTVLDAIHAKKLHAFKLGARVYRIAADEVLRFERGEQAAS